MTRYERPLPQPDEANAPHWEGARQGRLMLQACGACGTLRFPAARLCAACGSEESGWREVSGRGEVWSFCLFHKAYFAGFEPALPYNVVLVKLVEGPLLFSNLVGVDNGAIRIGLPVVAHFDPVTPEVTLVKFRPAP